MKSLHEFKVTNEMIQAAKSVFAATAMLKVMEPKILAVKKAVLTDCSFLRAQEHWISGEENIVLEPFDVFMLSEGDFDIYLAKVYDAYAANGIKAEFGFCPLQHLKDIKFRAEDWLIETFEPQLCISVEQARSHRDRPKLVNLMLELVRPHCSFTLESYLKGE